MKRIIHATATLFLLLLTASAQEDVRLNPADTITHTELKDHVYFLASDEMGGRVIYTDDYKVAAQYCASQFRQARLKPIKKTDEDAPYLHEVPLVKKTLRAASVLTIRNGPSTHTFDATVETRYLMQADVSVFSMETPVVFAGYGISAPEHGWNDFDGLEIDGKIIVVVAGAPKQKGQPVLPADIHKKLDSTNPIIR